MELHDGDDIFGNSLNMLRSISSRFSRRSSQPSSSSLIENQTLNQTSNIFKEEIHFENINQEIDNWEIPKIPEKELYKPEGKWYHSSDYIIRTVEKNIPIDPDVGEEFHLLSETSLIEHQTKKYNFLHIGCVQIAIKPLIREGLNTSILLCLRDIRHNKFQDSLLGTVETSLSHGPIYFNCYPNRTISLADKNIRDALFLNLKIDGLDMKPGSIPATLMYRIQYKVMNSSNSHVLKTKTSGETTLFLTDITKANVSVPKTILWKDVVLPEKWTLDKATPAIPRITPNFREIRQFSTGSVELVFDRRNSFSSASSSKSEDFKTEDFRSALSRRSMSSLRTPPSNINLQGLDTSSSIPRPSYQQEDDQQSLQSPTYSSLNDVYDDK